MSESHQSDDEGLYGQFLCTATYFYDDNDRLREETKNGSVVTYTYDNNGNTLSRSVGTETVTYGYDYENRLVSVQGTGSATEYAYDADGIRVRSVTGGVVTNYLADKNRDYAQVLEERDGGSLTAGYVYGDDLISRKQNGEVRYYLYDGHGSVRQLTDAAGNVTDSYSCDAFGNLRDHTGTSDNRYLYAGEQYDPNAGLYYLRARYYDPANGRFMSHDPHPGNLYEPVTLHRYLYANANPVMYSDPSGKFGITEMLETMNILNVLSKVGLAWGVINAADSYLSLVGKKTIKWTGRLFAFTQAWEGIGPGFGLFRAQLFSESLNGKITEGNYMMFLLGYTWSLPPVSFALGEIEMRTPSVHKSDPYVFQGPCSWISGTLTPIPNWTASLFTMGEGAGKIGIDPLVLGYDYGIDIMGGYSWRIPGSWGDWPF